MLTVAADPTKYKILATFVQAAQGATLGLQLDGAAQAHGRIGYQSNYQTQWLMLTTAEQACCILQPDSRCFAALKQHQGLFTAWHVPSLLHALLALPQGEQSPIGSQHLPQRWACASLCHQLLHYGCMPPPLEQLAWVSNYGLQQPPDGRAGLQDLAANGCTLVRLIAIMGQQLQQQQLQRVSRIEHQAIFPITTMEQIGLPCNKQQWLACCEAELQAIEQHPGKRTAALQHRQRRLQQFGPTWSKYIRPNGRIHTTFLAIGATTGRMTCTNPNLQALIDCPQRRACFQEAGQICFVMADYGACELRILAQASKEPVLLAGCAAQQDIHQQVANKLFTPTTDAAVRQQQRQQAKLVSFGLIYGMGVERLATMCQLSRSAAQALLERYFAAMPTLADYLQQASSRLHNGHQLRTLTGRLLSVGEHSKQDLGRLQRLARNMPIQGTGADLIKLALSDVAKRITNIPSAQLVHVVHDEIIVRCHQSDGLKTAQAVQAGMMAAGRAILPDVPIAVDTHIAWYWSKHAPAVSLTGTSSAPQPLHHAS